MSEKTTFSYPAKILPPVPQNIAKNVVVIENITTPFPRTYDITSKGTDNRLLTLDNAGSNYGYFSNLDVFKQSSIDIEQSTLVTSFKWSMLDPTLYIQSLSDLAIFYSSILISGSGNFKMVTNPFRETVASGAQESSSFVDEIRYLTPIDNEGNFQFELKININDLISNVSGIETE